MAKIKVAEGDVEIRLKKYHYEFYSDNSNVFVKILHPGKKDNATEFMRNDKITLKEDMEKALKSKGVL